MDHEDEGEREGRLSWQLAVYRAATLTRSLQEGDENEDQDQFEGWPR
jgi:hypothetical protein